jgi:hypothetical protein
LTVLPLVFTLVAVSVGLKICPGETRGERLVVF